MRRSVQKQNRKRLNQRKSIRSINLFGGGGDIEKYVEVQVDDQIALLRLPKVNSTLQLFKHSIAVYDLYTINGAMKYSSDTIHISSIPSLSGYTFTVQHVPDGKYGGYFYLTRKS
jgi:hypothetical protein